MWSWKEIGIEMSTDEVREFLEDGLFFELVKTAENPVSCESPDFKRGEDYHVTVLEDPDATRIVFSHDNASLWGSLAIVFMMKFPDSGILLFDGDGVTGVGDWWVSERGARNLIHVEGEQRVGLFNRDLSVAFSRRTGVDHVGTKRAGTRHHLYKVSSLGGLPFLEFLESLGTKEE